MAEIHVQSKKHNASPAWIWILVVLALVVAVAYFLTRNNRSADPVMDTNTTAYVISKQNIYQPPWDMRFKINLNYEQETS